LYEEKLRYLDMIFLKIYYLFNFSRLTAVFPAARDPNFQPED